MNIRDRFAEGGGIVLEGDEATDKSARLFAPTVPAARKGGIRKDDLESNINDKLEVLVPWATGFLRGDMLLLYWGLPGVPIDTIQIDNPNDSVFTLMAPVTDIARVGDGLIDVWYERISSFGDPVPIESPHVQVLVKTDVPGGNDPDQSTWPINEGLAEAILPPGPIETVPPEGLPVEIPMWENMAAGDVVTIFWGSAQGVAHRPITEAEVGQPVVVTVPEAIIIEAGAGEGVAVTYELVDKVQNWSGRAPSAFIDVEVGDAIYDAPAVAGLNDDNELDYDGLNGDDVTVVVMKNNDMAAGDGVSLVFQGRSYEGLEVEHTQTLTLSGTVMMFDLPNATLGQVVPGQGSVFYRVSTAGVYKGRSYRAAFTLRGTAAALPAPRVLEATEDGELDPAKVPNGATVEVEPWQGYGVGDVVRLRWNGVTAGGDPVSHADIYEITQGNISDPVRFVVPYSKIGPIALGRVEVHYTVESGNSHRTSETLTLEVLGVASLAPPIVEGEMGGELDPANAPNGAKVTIPAWQNIAVGDTVKWFWIGTSEGGQAQGEQTVSAVGDVVVTVPRGVIEINANGGDTVNVLYEVEHAAVGKSTSLPKTFVVLPIGKELLPAPIVKEAIDDILDPDEAVPDATVVVMPYEGMARDDVVEVMFAEGTPGEHVQKIPVTNNDVGEPVVMYVPQAKVELLEGMTVVVRYTVTNLAGQSSSHELNLTVERSAVWPAPFCEQALDGDYLPDGAYENGARVVIREQPAMKQGDQLDLYWGEDSRLYHDYVGIVVPMDFSFTVPKYDVDLWYGEVVPVHYTVTRGGRVMTSDFLHLRVALYLPDLAAPEVVQAPQGVLNPMDARQGATVRVTYESMQPGDSIQVSWDGDSSLPPAMGNAGGTLDITVPPGMVANCIGRTVPVSYTVTRGGFETDSAVLLLTVSAFKPGNLPMPTIIEQNGGVLNLSEFSGNATARQPAWPLMTTGQRIWWRVFGTQSNGNSLTISLELGHEITAAEAGKPLDRILQRTQLERLQDGSSLILEVKVAFDGNNDEADAVVFRTRTLTVAHSLTLPAPTVREATDDVLEPIDAQNGATVSVKYDDMKATDVIELVWDDDADFGTHPGSPTGEIDIPVPREKVIPYVGRVVKVYYRVTRNGVVSASGILSLTVDDFEPGELPTPEVPQAQGGILRLASFSGNPLVNVAPWPLIDEGQKVWLRVYGTLDDGAADTIAILQAHVVTPAEVNAGLSNAIPRARLEALKNQSVLRVELRATFDGGTDETGAQVFPELRLTLETVPDLSISPSEMRLNGLAVKRNGWPTTGQDAPGNAQTRTPTGGVPPYRYESSKSSVATVNAAGKVVGEGNGRATITVTDSRGAAVSYPVVVSNVFSLEIKDPPVSFPNVIAWVRGLGGKAVLHTHLDVLRKVYVFPYPMPSFGASVWLPDAPGCYSGACLCFRLNYGDTYCGRLDWQFCAWCLTDRNG